MLRSIFANHNIFLLFVRKLIFDISIQRFERIETLFPLDFLDLSSVYIRRYIAKFRYNLIWKIANDRVSCKSTSWLETRPPKVNQSTIKLLFSYRIFVSLLRAFQPCTKFLKSLHRERRESENTKQNAARSNEIGTRFRDGRVSHKNEQAVDMGTRRTDWKAMATVYTERRALARPRSRNCARYADGASAVRAGLSTLSTSSQKPRGLLRQLTYPWLRTGCSITIA